MEPQFIIAKQFSLLFDVDPFASLIHCFECFFFLLQTNRKLLAKSGIYLGSNQPNMLVLQKTVIGMARKSMLVKWIQRAMLLLCYSDGESNTSARCLVDALDNTSPGQPIQHQGERRGGVQSFGER